MIIQPGLLYLTRSEWGADTSIPRLGYTVARSNRTEAIIHHTVIVDSDATKNLWTDLNEVKTKMRQLQTIRPDLGMDVPYNFVMFLMEDGSVIVCEGRGLDRTGAHTRGHNTDGVATALQGNFMLAVDLVPYVPLISRWWGWQKYDQGMTNLGSVRPTSGPNAGAIAFGHIDLASTSCPGINLHAIIPQLEFTKEDDMPTQEEFDTFKRDVNNQLGALRVAFGWPQQFGDVSQEHIGNIIGKLEADIAWLKEHANDADYHHSMDKIKAAVDGGGGLQRGDKVTIEDGTLR